MKILTRIKPVFTVFPVIMSCVSLAAAAYIELFWETDTSSGAQLIWELALCSFLCSFCPLFYGAGGVRGLSARSIFLRGVLCFLYVNSVVLLSGFAFDWFHIRDWRMLLGMEITIIAVYAAVSAVFYLRARKDAERVNQRLQSRDS